MLDHPDVLRPQTGWRGDFAWQLHCPRCGTDAVDRFGREGGSDHMAVAMEPDRDSHVSPVGTRGGYVQIELSCAVGHRFNLVIGNHKGAEIIGVLGGDDVQPDEIDLLWDDAE